MKMESRQSSEDTSSGHERTIENTKAVLSELDKAIANVRSKGRFYERMFESRPYEPALDQRNIGERQFQATEIIRAFGSLLLMDDRVGADGLMTSKTLVPLAEKEPQLVREAADKLIAECAKTYPELISQVTGDDVLAILKDPNHPFFFAVH